MAVEFCFTGCFGEGRWPQPIFGMELRSFESAGKGWVLPTKGVFCHGENPIAHISGYDVEIVYSSAVTKDTNPREGLCAVEDLRRNFPCV